MGNLVNAMKALEVSRITLPEHQAIRRVLGRRCPLKVVEQVAPVNVFQYQASSILLDERAIKPDNIRRRFTAKVGKSGDLVIVGAFGELDFEYKRVSGLLAVRIFIHKLVVCWV